jgi:hypothetical protein
MFSLAQANPGELVEVPNLSLVPRLGRIAQLVEQLTLNQRVQGSSPCAPTRQNKDLAKIIIYIVLLGKQPVSGSIFRASKENPRYYWRPHRRIWIDIAGACLIPKVRDYFF